MDFKTLVILAVTAASIILIIIIAKSIIDGSSERIFDISKETQEGGTVPYSAIDETCELCHKLADESPIHLAT